MLHYDHVTYNRPRKVKKYEKQRSFMDCPERFTIIEASTKSGKTAGCLVWLFEQALQGKHGQVYWWLAPVLDNSRVAFERMCTFISDRDLFRVNQSRMTITLSTGAVIFFKTAENPGRLYGEDVTAVVIDEACRMKEAAWPAVISVTTKTKGKVKIIGNVSGIQNWAYDLARKVEAGEKEDWAYFKITADDAVEAKVFDNDALNAARQNLETGEFNQLYYNIPNVNESNRFCYAFNEKQHVAECRINKDNEVYLSFDFNRNPICCAVIQCSGTDIWVNEIIKLKNSDIYNLCAVIRTNYPGCHYIVTGDASGRASWAMVHDGRNYYQIIERELNVPEDRIQVPAANPLLKHNSVLVNAVFQHGRVRISPTRASALIDDCKFVQVLPNGSINKANRRDPKQQSDALDCFRYFCNQFVHNVVTGW